MRFHHLGVATKRLGRERHRYEELGYRPTTGEIVDERLGVRLQFLELAGAPTIELVASLDGELDSPVDAWLARGVHVYHYAYEVHDIDAAIAWQRERGGFLVSPPQPAVAFGGREVAFLTFNPSMLLEFIQES